MSVDHADRLGRQLRRALRPPADDWTDGQLLRRFVGDADEGAFEELVRRHGGMVLGVCRRILGNAHDADDAFQAAFIVVVRKARELARRGTIGDWLYGVAYHTALKARAVAMKRRDKEARARRPEPATEPDWLPLLDQELNRLPEKYRVPVVLCELEGRPRREVAEMLGIPEGTLSSRLTTARRQLGDRLRRRGVAPGEFPALAALPAALLDATVRASRVTAGHLAVGMVPAAVARLAREVTQMMLLNKLLLGATVGVILLAFSLAALPFLAASPANDPPPKADPPARPAAKAAPAAAELPAWKKEFHKAYGLENGEILKRVGSPFPECRMDYYRNDMAWQHKHIPDPPRFFAFTWKDGKPAFHTMITGTTGGADQGVALATVLDVIGVAPQWVTGPEELREKQVVGDWVIRHGVPAEKLVARLGEILRKDCGLAVKLSFKEVEREVVVATGKFVSRPLKDRKVNAIDLYALNPVPNSGAGGGSGTLDQLLRALGSFTNVPVVNEVQEGPKGRLTWYYHIRSPQIVDPANGVNTRAEDTDPKAVLANVEAQTGLKLVVVKRKVRVLAVEKE